MFKLKTITCVLILKCLFSCNEGLKNNMDSKSDSIAISRDAIQNKIVENTSSYNEEHIIQEHTQFTTLYFESFSITLNQEYNADYLNSNTVITADTIILNASLGTDFNHQYITFLD
jgi:hypothetical protein